MSAMEEITFFVTDDTMNGTNDSLESSHDIETGGQMVAGMALILLSIVTALGNSLVIHAIRTEKRLQTVSNAFLMSLAVADLTIGVIVMPISAAYTMAGEWRWSRDICQFWLATDYTASTASIFNLVVLTLDRYWSVMAPLRYLRKRTRRRAGFLLAMVWLTASLWLIPLFAWKYLAKGTVHKESLCETDFAHDVLFKLVTSAVNFYFPSVLIVVLYYRIFKTIKHRTSNFPSSRNHQVLGRMTSTSSEEQNIEFKNFSNSHRKENNSTSNGELRVETQMFKALTIIGMENKSNTPQSYDNITVRVEYLTDRSCHLNHRACYPPENHRFHSNLALNSNSHFSGGSNNGQPSNHLRRNYTTRETSKLSRPCLTTLNARRFHSQCKSTNMSLLKEKKAARQLGIIMGAFLACWVPYFTIFPVIAFCNSCVPQSAHMATISLGYLNSALNPIIYPLCNHHFRRAFARMLKCKNFDLDTYSRPVSTQ